MEDAPYRKPLQFQLHPTPSGGYLTPGDDFTRAWIGLQDFWCADPAWVSKKLISLGINFRLEESRD